MAESQLQCLDDAHVNERISDSKAEYYYSEQQRIAIDELVEKGEHAFKERIKQEKMKEFVSAKELKMLRKRWRKYESTGKEGGDPDVKDQEAEGSLNYWPVLSDIEIPALDLGWPIGGYYKGVTRVTVHVHPPKDNGPHIKAVVRKLIQQSQKVIAVVMDHFTDMDIFRDMLDAEYKRKVPVYIILDEGGVQYFLEMCQRMELTDFMIRSLRVRSMTGVGFCTASGKIRGGLSHRFMLIDGDKVTSGSYCFTWTASRIDRNIITVMTGQIVETFDLEFRELYANSEEVNLYKELNIPQYKQSAVSKSAVDKTTIPTPNPYSAALARKLMVNPKYALVTGANLAPGDMISYSSSSRNPIVGVDMKTEDATSRIQRYLDTLVDSKEDWPEMPEYVSEPSKKKKISTFHLDLKGKAQEEGKKGEKDKTEMGNGGVSGEANTRRSKRGLFPFMSRKDRGGSKFKKPSLSELPNGNSELLSTASVMSENVHGGSFVIVEKVDDHSGPHNASGDGKKDKMKDNLGSRLSASLQSLGFGFKEESAGDVSPTSNKLRRRPSKRGCIQS